MKYTFELQGHATVDAEDETTARELLQKIIDQEKLRWQSWSGDWAIKISLDGVRNIDKKTDNF